ncbi:hypothetical protein CAOG_04804 [Capsaspora owczarzaki ATCC 30864]|uniref:AAA+ ATPase domain-containing protein n=1 Tax=Capsaspora owczarzaki (strain ATCC 30864) TaxID=595528 RepID=A0A0D2UGE2_CAPO3|nr:hypothetical protein CAOG_04804 [Capsaspora owczarzaki ATCC 30864]KJE94116.1 hypothetical protein CAOG_004804 [Capsaspora owczarzaki ATCC 30864]|eukprot:XP_004347555.1 hypothetical protein CAOG_04804 [Capsaspora owczarzaki ATCC 30864]
MDSATQVETQSEFRLHQLRLQNFKKFEDITLTLTPSPKIIVGANGSGKTQILWAILIFLRGHNSRIPSSKHFHSDPFRFTELEDLFGDRAFLDSVEIPDTLVRVGTSDKKFTLTGTFHDSRYHGTNKDDDPNVHAQMAYSLKDGLLLDKSHHKSLAPIRFAFLPPTYQWGTQKFERPVDHMFLSAGVQHLRNRLDQQEAVDFVNQALVHLKFQAKLTVVASSGRGPVDVTVTENGVTLDIGVCAGSLQKIIAILTLLYHLTSDATAQAVKKEGKPGQNTFKQRIFLIDELEALLYESVASKLYAFLVNTCAEHDIQLIVATNSRAIIEQRLDTRQDVLFLTWDGKAVEISNNLPYKQVQEHLFPVLDALSQVKDSKPILVLEGKNDEEFYRKYTTLGQHFHFLTTSGAVNKQSVSNILTQAKLKHVFLRDSDMYAASPDLTAAQARITKIVGAPVVYTLLPCIESYLILHRLLKSADADTRRLRVVQALPQRKSYFVATFKTFCRESSDSALVSASSLGEPAQDPASELASSENDGTIAMLDRVLADSENGPEVLWNSLLARLTTEGTSFSSSFDRKNRVSFWTTYVKMVRGHDFMPDAADFMGSLECKDLDRDVKALLAQTEQAVLACLR